MKKYLKNRMLLRAVCISNNIIFKIVYKNVSMSENRLLLKPFCKMYINTFGLSKEAL